MSAIQQIQPFTGQSNYDICAETYGNLDYFIKLVSDNNLSSSSTVSNSPYSFDTTVKNINSNFIGISYSTLS